MNTKLEVTAKTEDRPFDLTELDEVSAAGFIGIFGSLLFETGLRLSHPVAADVLYGNGNDFSGKSGGLRN